MDSQEGLLVTYKPFLNGGTEIPLKLFCSLSYYAAIL